MVRSVFVALLAIGCTRPPADQARPTQAANQAPASPAPTAGSPTRPNTVPRDKLDTSMMQGVALPAHGLVLQTWTMGGEALVTVDFDAATLQVVSIDRMTAAPSPRTTSRALTAREMDALRTTAQAAWRVDPVPPTPRATDIRQDLTILDGDEAFRLSGHPIALDAESYPNSIGATVVLLNELATSS